MSSRDLPPGDALAGRPEAEDDKDPPHILVVDDDERLRSLLRRYLSDNGFVVSAAADAEEARRQLSAMTFDLMVLDVMMPGEDGLSLARGLRNSSVRLPILMLTARDQADDRIAGLESGVDDYLSKPFEPRELVLRITAILRRGAAVPEVTDPVRPAVTLVPLGACVYDRARQELRCDDQPVRLTTAEVALLDALADRAGEPVSREELAALTEAEGNLRAIDVQVTRLRKKIEPDPRVPRHLQTVRGKGYLLRPG